MLSDTKPGHPSFLMTGNSDGMEVAARGSTGVDLEKLEMWIESPDGEKRVLRTMTTEPIYPGEICYTKSPGGGGWGDPVNRTEKKVQDDVQDGLISLKKAKDVYGVVLDPLSFYLKYKETEELRCEMKNK
jgi:N-methylhydantoinase B